MRYRRDVVLKDGSACLLRSAEASDARECFDVFQVTHAETDYLLSYPDENPSDGASRTGTAANWGSPSCARIGAEASAVR